jgi:uncharacterized membrane protein
MVKAENFFSKEEKNRIAEAIGIAEKNTSGEIRVHIENRCKSDVLDCATYIFEKLQMHKTKDRNGVLFYLAVADRKYAILGDAGINKVAPENFWDEIKITMHNYFREEKFAEGIIIGINMAGEALQKYFPYNAETDVNELSDEISFGKR